ncbi:MAG: pitrilysin family protein [Pseudomonadota bacterium]
MTMPTTPDVRSTTLDNGLTVLSERMPHLATVSLGVWVRAGGRHETQAENGLSHLLEHMAFKGTKRRTAQAIVEEIEDVGGDLNAATSTENTAYYVRSLAEHLETGVDVLADILLNPLFDDTELMREKDVILQEIAGIQDSPDDVVYDLMQDAAFTDQPLGRPIIGTPDSVTAMTRDNLVDYRARNYVGRNIVVAAAGDVDHERLVDLVRARFSGLDNAETTQATSAEFVGGIRATDRPFEQAHVLISFPGVSFRDDSYFASQIFANAFGGGMSSRLFQEARERRGLCYSIYASSWGLSDTGLFMMHAATGREQVAELSDVMLSELDTVADEGLSDRELLRAKAQLKTGLMMSLESPSSRAEQMARQHLAWGRTITPNELIDKVEAVTGHDVAAFADRLRQSAQSAVAVIGAETASEDLAKRAHDRIGRAA